MVDFDTSDLSFKLESVTFEITVNSRSPHIVPTRVFIYQILKQCFKCFFLRENKSKLSFFFLLSCHKQRVVVGIVASVFSSLLFDITKN